jgi:acyl carrier protein
MPDTEGRLRSLVSKILKVDPASIGPKSHFVRDLGMESVQSIELIAAIEEEFDIEIDEGEVGDVLTFEKSLGYVKKMLGE